MAAASDARGDVRDVGSNYQQLNTTAATAATAAVEADIRLTKVNTSTASTQSTTRHEGLVSVKASPRRDVVPTHSADVLSMNLTTAGSPGIAYTVLLAIITDHVIGPSRAVGRVCAYVGEYGQ